MVVRRNRRMANGIHELLSNTRNKTFFIALGAGESIVQFCVFVDAGSAEIVYYMSYQACLCIWSVWLGGTIPTTSYNQSEFYQLKSKLNSTNEA